MDQAKKSHLTQDERVTIQTMLAQNNSPYQIANAIGKSASTISREIDKHAENIKAKLLCKNRNSCVVQHLCSWKYCSKLCSQCRSVDCVTKNCKYFEPDICEKLLKSPHVCNGCSNFKNCRLEKRVYKAIKAQTEYKSMLVDKREGFDLTKEQIKEIDILVTPLVKAGHSPYAISIELGDKLPCSVTTLYRLIDASVFEARNIDLYDKVKRKPRKRDKITNKDYYTNLAKAKEGRLWQDYLSYIETHPDVHTVQMDCVEGKKEDNAVLLTLHWTREHMQLYFIMDNQSHVNVVKQLDKIEKTLGYELFQEMFPIILTDNGQEFTDIEGMERSCLNEGQRRTKIFFCEPNRSDEKGHCERNHRELRKIIPKGTSLEGLTQIDMNLVSNHVNSYVRASLGGVSPYDLAIDEFDDDFFMLLGLEKIPMKDVILKPIILKKKE